MQWDFFRRKVGAAAGGGGMTRGEIWLLWLICAFFLSLFLPDMPVVTNVTIGAIFVFCLFFNSPGRSWGDSRRGGSGLWPGEKWRLLKGRPAVWLMILFFLFQTVSAAVSQDWREGFAELGLRSPLIVFPLSLGLIVIRPVLKLRLVAVYCFVTTLMALFCLARAIFRVWHTGDAQWLYDDSLTDIIGKQSVYIALMTVIAIFGYFYLLAARYYLPRRRWASLAAVGLLLIFHYLLASRVSILFLYSSFFLLGTAFVFRRGGRRVLPGVSVLVVLAIGFLLVFPKTLNRFRELRYTEYNFTSNGVESHYNMPVTKDQWNGANIRLAIWQCGIDLVKGHWLTGIPLGDKQAQLQRDFKARGFVFAFRSNRNLHNTYLDVLVNTGIPGLIIFLLGYLVAPLFAASAVSGGHRTRASGTGLRIVGGGSGRDLLGVGIVAAFAAAMITETWIDKGFGCILLGFWLSTVAAWGKTGTGSARGARW